MAWITEGTAEWVADTVAPVSTDDDGWPISYIDSSLTPLFQRTYDAIGFWGHVQDSVGDLASRLPAVLTAKDNAAAYAIATKDDEAFLNAWGTSVFRIGSSGSSDVWRMASPVIPPFFVDHQPAQMVWYDPSVLGSTDPIDAPPYTTAQYVIAPPGDEPLLHVTIKGHARLGVTEGYTSLDGVWFCTGSDCRCPRGETGTPPPTQPLKAPAFLGLSGDDNATGTYGDVTSYPLSKFCEKPKDPTPNRGIDNGDPYVKTFDGGGFGFQQAGEFTLVKSRTDDLEIQGRQQPYPSVRYPGYADSLALNTAFAMHVGKAIVEVDKGHQLVLYVNRKLEHPTEGQTISLDGGGIVKYSRFFTRVTWPDGTNASLLLIGREGVNLFVSPAAARAGHLTGLMGNDDGGSANDYVGRNGHRYPPSVVDKVGLFSGNSKAARRVVYGQFGHSWRITQKESLFTYPPGRTTSSYTVKGFPKGPIDLAALNAGQRRSGKQACSDAHVTDPILLAGCEIDVGATGKKQFATSDGALQTAVTQSLSAPVTPPGPVVSTVPWGQLSSAPDNTTIVVPTIASSGGQAVVAYRRGTDQTVEAATFAPSATGIGPVSTAPVLTGWVATTDPVLLGAPGGGLQALVPGDHTAGSDPLNGVVAVPRNPAGSWGAPVSVSPTPDGGVTGAILSADGTTPLWALQGGLTVYDGATKRDLSASSPGSAYGVTFGRDTSGRLWIGWYVISLTPGVSGDYMMQLDPMTGAALEPPAEAPDSGGPNGDGVVALACAAQCRLIYVTARRRSSRGRRAKRRRPRRSRRRGRSCPAPRAPSTPPTGACGSCGRTSTTSRSTRSSAMVRARCP